MSEGPDFKALQENVKIRVQMVKDGIAAAEETVTRLEKLGLTRRGAIKCAFKLLEIDLPEEDIESGAQGSRPFRPKGFDD